MAEVGDVVKYQGPASRGPDSEPVEVDGTFNVVEAGADLVTLADTRLGAELSEEDAELHTYTVDTAELDKPAEEPEPEQG